MNDSGWWPDFGKLTIPSHHAQLKPHVVLWGHDPQIASGRDVKFQPAFFRGPHYAGVQQKEVRVSERKKRRCRERPLSPQLTLALSCLVSQQKMPESDRVPRKAVPSDLPGLWRARHPAAGADPRRRDCARACRETGFL